MLKIQCLKQKIHWMSSAAAWREKKLRRMLIVTWRPTEQH